VSRRILSVFGTRPEAIKMAPLVRAIQSTSELHGIVAVTAQHRQMLDQVLELFDIAPDFDLDIMKPNQDLFDVTSRVLLGLRDVIREAKPDVVLVHGDTTTCFAAGLAAFYLQVPVGHVEAGLRTGNLQAPFPEEANRTLVGRIARYHFAPTDGAKQNLLKENVDPATIFVTGNTVIDALLDVRARLPSFTEKYWRSRIPPHTVDAVRHRSGRFILITGHRRESFGQGFQDFCTALARLADAHPDWILVYPVHLNPNVQKPVYEMLADRANIHLIDPLDYLPFVWLLDQCDLVITDSGGIQEEAPSFGKPVLVTREVTERPEAIEAGTVILVGTCTERIIGEVEDILNDNERYQRMALAHNPYGDGQATQRIVKALLS
jgi:UDP-N-acetylglucosamine 2-epimerase (non-hydrolysing)